MTAYEEPNGERCPACGERLAGDLAETARGVIHADCIQPGEEIA